MKLIGRLKWMRGYREKKKKKVAGGVDAGAGSNTRQVAPDDLLPFQETTGYASSRDEAFFEASAWLDSDCEDDFFSVNGDATPARTIGSDAAVQKLPTLEAILKAEPLTQQQQMKLADFLKEKEEDGEAGRCCIPQFARAISCKKG